MFTEPFYKARTIGDNIDVTFGFIRENIKTVVKTAMLFSIPICVIMEVLYVFNVIEETSDYIYNSYESYTWDTMDTIIFVGILVNIIIIMPLALSIININYNRKGGTENITMKEAWKYIKSNLGKSFIMPFSQAALCLVPIFIIIAFTEESKFLSYCLLAFLFFIITANCLPAYCVGKHSYSTSISKGFHYGFTKLFVILGFSILIILVGSLIYLWEIGAMELMDNYLVEFLGTDISGNLAAYIVFWIIKGALWALITISVNLALMAVTIGLAFQFGSFEEKNCHIELKKKIENFDNLKES